VKILLLLFSLLLGVPTWAFDHLEIPRLRVEVPLFHGAYLGDLNKGASIWSWTSNPGEYGNTVVGAHRTVGPGYFKGLNQLEKGDEIKVEWRGRWYTYVVTRSFVLVRPHEPNIIDELVRDKDWLTLVTCHPMYQDTERLVVRAIRSD
jgi:sortase A